MSEALLQDRLAAIDRNISAGSTLHHNVRQPHIIPCPPSAADLVFPTSTGKIEHHVTMLHGLKTVMRAAGVVDRDGKPKYALHGFRHFFASWCINPQERGGRELPPKVVQHLLGHSSIVMTLDVYGHLFPHGNDRTELAEASAACWGDMSKILATCPDCGARRWEIAATTGKGLQVGRDVKRPDIITPEHHEERRQPRGCGDSSKCHRNNRRKSQQRYEHVHVLSRCVSAPR